MCWFQHPHFGLLLHHCDPKVSLCELFAKNLKSARFQRRELAHCTLLRYHAFPFCPVRISGGATCGILNTSIRRITRCGTLGVGHSALYVRKLKLLNCRFCLTTPKLRVRNAVSNSRICPFLYRTCC